MTAPVSVLEHSSDDHREPLDHAGHQDHDHEPDEHGATGALIPPTLSARIVSLIGVTFPFIGFIAAIAFLWDRGFDWLHGGLLLGMYVISAIGVTVGYHRYFCHRSFQTSRVV